MPGSISSSWCYVIMVSTSKKKKKKRNYSKCIYLVSLILSRVTRLFDIVLNHRTLNLHSSFNKYLVADLGEVMDSTKEFLDIDDIVGNVLSMGTSLRGINKTRAHSLRVPSTKYWRGTYHVPRDLVPGSHLVPLSPNKVSPGTPFYSSERFSRWCRMTQLRVGSGLSSALPRAGAWTTDCQGEWVVKRVCLWE